MRHGSVDYFDATGKPLPPDAVPLNATGQLQADAAGALFAERGVRFDAVVASGLPRTLQTAERALAAAGQRLVPQIEPAWQEIRGGRLADLAEDQIEHAFLGAFRAQQDVEAHRFLGGESIGELLDRVLPPWLAWCERSDWRCLLLVLHGGVNRALLSHALCGQRAFFGRLEQNPACINVLDVDGPDSIVVRAVNLAPTQWLHELERLTTMEKLLAEYRRRDAATPSLTERAGAATAGPR
ncbi:MAG TPA: histidine phosphatase family protein [Methylibium sp.]|uniref:histidine phosphatase family protein n=1 Tax=Methylibium sp. TaxID=2067992 RepID=UPI002DBC8DA6|nr:histidine phosphatase family protein [Methylibium sp.]HEU4460169.1 histidine phosphatase family protein [Methylibium sp.]